MAAKRWTMFVAAVFLVGSILGATALSEGASAAQGGVVVSNYTGSGVSLPEQITSGPDSALWFTNFGNDSIGRVSAAGSISNFSEPGIVDPTGITAGPDGALWFANGTGNSIGRITPAGAVSTFPDTSIDDAVGIALGSDGALWFTNFSNDSIGRITTSGVVSNFSGTGIDNPTSIATGPDGALWFINTGNDSIGRITTTGVVSNFSGAGIVDAPGVTGGGITAGSDGAMWFTNADGVVGRITMAGTISSFTVLGASNLNEIAAGPDGALWFTAAPLGDEAGGSFIGRITTGGVITDYTDATIDGPVGITAGPDGALWFTNLSNDSIGRITTPGLADTITSPSTNPTADNLGDSVTYTANVTSTVGIPSGTVSFATGASALCTATLINGVASCGAANAAAGDDTVVATYSGDGTFAASSGATTLLVTPPSPPPVITSIIPSSGPVAGGTLVNIFGSNFTNAYSVNFGGLSGTALTIDSPTQISVRTPAATVGTVNVTVTTLTGTSPTTLADQYTFIDPSSPVPSISQITPNSGSYAGGTPVVITGANLLGATGVTFGGQTAATYQVVNATTVDATTPPGTAGSVGVEVKSTQGLSSPGVFTYVGGPSTAPPPVAPTPVPNPTIPTVTSTPSTQGYWLVAKDGGVFSFNKPFYGSTGNIHLAQPIVGMAQTADGGGYWFVAKDGGVFAFGDAVYQGSVPGSGTHVSDVVGIVADHATGGYWVIGADGSVWGFNVPQVGSLPIFGIHVSNIVGGATTPDGAGLYLVSATGKVYSLLGDGVLQGDASGLALKAPIVSMTVDPATGGYWLLGKDGGVFSFNAPFFGSTGNMALNQPVVGMSTTADGQGYWFVAADGGVFSYGDAVFHGSTGAMSLNQPVVGMSGS